jgi:transposase
MAPKSVVPKMLKGGYSKLEEMISQEKNPKVKDRLRVIYWKFKKHSNAEIARKLGYTSLTVSKWITNWNKYGYEGLLDKKPPGRPSILNIEEQEQIINSVKNRQQGRITCKILVNVVKNDFEKDISAERIRVLLNKNNMSWKKPKKEDYRKDDEKREAFLKERKKKDS